MCYVIKFERAIFGNRPLGRPRKRENKITTGVVRLSRQYKSAGTGQ